MEKYRDNLRHVVRPEDPDDREEATYLGMGAAEALLLRRALQTYARYDASTQEHEDIALAYIEYIDMAVRDEAKSTIRLYIHTELAREVVEGAVDASMYGGPERKIIERLRDNLP